MDGWKNVYDDNGDRFSIDGNSVSSENVIDMVDGRDEIYILDHTNLKIYDVEEEKATILKFPINYSR